MIAITKMIKRMMIINNDSSAAFLFSAGAIVEVNIKLGGFKFFSGQISSRFKNDLPSHLQNMT